MRVLVTGVAGFIGSRLAERLLADGHVVVGVDSLADNYTEERKRANLEAVLENGGEFIEADLADTSLDEALADCEVIFHLAAIPGVRASWNSFDDYIHSNVRGTHRLLEAARHTDVGRIVYASSSSVYGDALRYPSREGDAPKPHSPYGVSKLAGEQLCLAYAENFGLPAVSLRLFSVYGPRQRPDMGVYRIIDAALTAEPFFVYGSGAQVRDVTYVDDVVEACLAAGVADVPPGLVANVAGGTEISLNDLISMISQICDREVRTERSAEQPGDVHRTGGDISVARQVLGWEPTVSIEEGVTQQVRWQAAL